MDDTIDRYYKWVNGYYTVFPTGFCETVVGGPRSL